MIPEIEILKAKHLPDCLADAALKFVGTGDPSIPRGMAILEQYPWQAYSIGEALIKELPWNENVRSLLRFFIYLSDSGTQYDGTHHEYLGGVIGHILDEDTTVDPLVSDGILSEVESLHGKLVSFVQHFLSSHNGQEDWRITEIGNPTKPFIRPVANFLFKSITPAHAKCPELFTNHPGLLSVLSIQIPEVARAWCDKSSTFESWERREGWPAIINATDEFDQLCLSFAEAVSATDADDAFVVVNHLNQLRNGAHLETLLHYAAMPKAALGHGALEFLIKHRTPEVIEIMTRAFEDGECSGRINGIDNPAYRNLFNLMVEHWDHGGRQLLLNLVANYSTYRLLELLTDQLSSLDAIHFPTLREGIHLRMAKIDARNQTDLWRAISKSHPAAFIQDLEEMLVGKSKPLREIAASALAKFRGKSILDAAHEMLSSKKADARMGAAALIEQVCDDSSIPFLRHALENETSETVRSALHQALKIFNMTEAISAPVCVGAAFDINQFVASQSKGLKLPKVAWLETGKLPPLLAIKGTPLPENAVMLMIAKQSKHKSIEASPDILPLLAHIDREKSPPFAAALVEDFLNSEQAAADRWALTLGGLLGDNRIITLLLPRINDWCENSRHKLAEYAAQAISLLPGNEPLMVLDTLSNRYRSKFKNVGKTCADAFNSAAAARGITADELGDLVVPDFGFDAAGIRRFDWEDGGASAELGTDFKLSWFDPETDKSWKALPANVPEEVKTEVKTLTTLLREAVKGQTARLELTLVRQRRWASSRWRELFENHPLLRSFASLLVWGVYDGSGHLLRTFRRYPNGLLADAAGGLEELAETDTMIGMVHPLEMDEAALANWRAHLARFKVKQPFPQIDRPAELMDPLHGNRREIAVTNGKKVSAGTFRSRAEKRGWTRGSVVDAGGISSYYKLYPGAGVEVILPTDNFWIGCDPMETIELASAYFTQAGSIERGSYIYNEPAPDDPRILRFDQVSAVVFSETLSDLKAIIATKE